MRCVVFSGDGTYNEAINGAAGKLPFGFVPGGGASVFPRALGLPRDPVAAAAQAVEALEAGRTISIALGRVNGRRFCFSAGIGLDAEAVRRDRPTRPRPRRAPGRQRRLRRDGGRHPAGAPTSGCRPQLEIEGFGRAAFVFVANGRPYTYLGPIPVTIAGRADFAGGLDFVAPRAISPAAAPGLALRGFRGTLDGDPRVLTGHDLDSFAVRCDRPLPLQADGEDLGDVTEATFEAERDALAVLF